MYPFIAVKLHKSCFMHFTKTAMKLQLMMTTSSPLILIGSIETKRVSEMRLLGVDKKLSWDWHVKSLKTVS